MEPSTEQLLSQHSARDRAKLQSLLGRLQSNEYDEIIGRLHGIAVDQRIRVMEQLLGLEQDQDHEGRAQQGQAQRRASSAEGPRRRRPRAASGRLRRDVRLPRAASAAVIGLALGLVLVSAGAWVPQLVLQAGRRALMQEAQPLLVHDSYVSGTVLNKTLALGEAAAAARLSPGPDRFTLHKLGTQAELVVQLLRQARHACIVVWPQSTSSTTRPPPPPEVDTLMQAKDAFREGASSALYTLDWQLSLGLYSMSADVNSTARAVAGALRMPLEAFAPRPPWPLSLVAQPLSDAALERRRDAAIWSAVCALQATLLGISDNMMRHIERAQAVVKQPVAAVTRPVEALLTQVAAQRHDVEQQRDALVFAYNATVAEWSQWKPSVWRTSAWLPVRCVGAALLGVRPPAFPHNALYYPERTQQQLEATQGLLTLISTHLDFAHALLTQTHAALLSNSAHRLAEQRHHSPATCDAVFKKMPARSVEHLQAAVNGTYPSHADANPESSVMEVHSPEEMLIFLYNTTNAFADSLLAWDREQFHEANLRTVGVASADRSLAVGKAIAVVSRSADN